jgi:glycosyltransferase involved in cell wall biosynthesis
LCEQLGRSARARVESEFSWQRAAERMEPVYARLTLPVAR